MATKKVIIGSRGSDLALWQANYVKDQLAQLGHPTEIKIIKTKGDQIQHLSFDKIEGKGFFTKEIENALLEEEIDLAVHSLKDLETDQPKGLCIGAVPPREDPSDCLLINLTAVDTTKSLSINKEAVVGTSSARRKNQLLLFREDLKIKDLRGNVPTRVQKLRNGDYDAIVLAKAGLNRLNVDLSEFHVFDLNPVRFIPAPAQGALGLQIREQDVELKRLLSKLNDPQALENVTFERKILNGIGGGCHSPFGAFSKVDKNGNRSTWVTYAKEVVQTPLRMVSKENDVRAIVKLVKRTNPSNKVWISRDLEEDSIFKKLVGASGHEITGKSCISKEILKLNVLPNCDWLFFNSAFSFDSIQHLKNDFKTKKVAAFGNATAHYIKKSGVKVDFVGDGSPQKVAQDFKALPLKNEIVFFPSSNRSIGTVASSMKEENKLVETTYNTVLLQNNLEGHSYLVFTSPSNVEAYFSANNYCDEKVVSIGPSTTKLLKQFGVKDVHEAYESSELALADTVLSLI